jgi:mitochondrial inner membrane protease subunit 2
MPPIKKPQSGAPRSTPSSVSAPRPDTQPFKETLLAQPPKPLHKRPSDLPPTKPTLPSTPSTEPPIPKKPSRFTLLRLSISRFSASFFRQIHQQYARLPQPIRHTVSFLYLLGIVITLLAPPAIVFRNHFYDIIRVTGPSMSPYLNTDFEDGTTGVHDITKSTDRILLKLYRPRSDLRRGMVVAFRTPHDPEKWAIKRIVALQGDRVFPLAHYPGLNALEERGLIIPFGHMWVEGDVSDSNKKDASLDSNTYGPISTGLVIGKATHVIASLFSRWARIDYTHFKLPGRVQTDAVTLQDPDEEYQSKEFEEMFQNGKAAEVLEALRMGLQKKGRVDKEKVDPELLVLFDVIRTQAERQVSKGDNQASEVAASLLAVVDDLLGGEERSPTRGAQRGEMAAK